MVGFSFLSSSSHRFTFPHRCAQKYCNQSREKKLRTVMRARSVRHMQSLMSVYRRFFSFFTRFSIKETPGTSALVARISQGRFWMCVKMNKNPLEHANDDSLTRILAHKTVKISIKSTLWKSTFWSTVANWYLLIRINNKSFNAKWNCQVKAHWWSETVEVSEQRTMSIFVSNV